MLNCPVCSTGLTEVDKAGVTIDTCPKCRGVWLDRGELEKLGERLAREDYPPTPARDDTVRGDRRAPAVYRDERPRHDDDRRRYSDYDDDDNHHRSGHKRSRLKSFMDFFD